MNLLESTSRTLALVGLAAFATGLGCRGYESEEPPIHLIRNMDTQERGKAYRADTTGLFADGRIMRPPVPGTVAQGQLGEDLLLEEGQDEEGNSSLRFPDAVKAGGSLPDTLIRRGQARYDIFCTPCHGVGLDGQGPLAQVGFDSNPRLTIPPPSLHDARIKTMPAGQIYAAIKNGVNQGNMGSYASQIPLLDRWAIVAYVRSQQKAKDPAVEMEGGVLLVVEATDTASELHGSQLYAAKGCNACHSLDGTRLVGPSFKALYGSTRSTASGDVVADAAYLAESIKEPAAKVVTGFPPVMPQLPLTDLEIESLSLYIQSLK
jgi:mono/diheme cytochrome c family protein